MYKGKGKKMISVMLCLILSLTVMSGFGMLKEPRTADAATNDYTSAPELDLTGNWSSAIAINEGDVHWYKITLTETGRVNARIMSYIDSRLEWELWDADFSEKLREGYVYGGTDTSPKTISDDFILSAGVYYYKIYSYRTGSYKIYDEFLDYMVNDEGADSYDSPYNYSLGTKITGAITETDEVDWYKISINKTGYYHQTIASYFLDGRLQWELWNTDLTEEIKTGYTGSYSSETTPSAISDDIYLESGTYYIKIYENWGYIGKYIFQFDKLTKKNCNHDYNSSWYDATYFAKGYKEYVCEKCGDSYRDNYKDVKVLSQGYLYYPSVEKNTIKLSWSKVYDASGYQIRYSTKRNFKSDVVVKTVKDVDVTEKTIKKLKRKTKYYVQVRPYKKGASKTVYGKWSEKKWIRTE